MKLADYSIATIAAQFLMAAGVCHADEYKEYNGEWAAKFAQQHFDTSYSQNPFHDFSSQTGGNCTNFVSQSIIAGLIKSDSLNEVYNARYDFDVDSGCYGNGLPAQ